MNPCSCGRTAEPAGNLCARCAALHTLELTPKASDQQVRDAYRVLVKVWHPDRFQSDPALRETAEARLKALNAAYALLTSDQASESDEAREPDHTRKSDRAREEKPHRAQAKPAAQPARTRSRARAQFRFPAAALLKFALAAGCVLMAGVFLLVLDSFFASDPSTGRVYSTMRAHVVANARETAGTIWSQAGQHWHEWVPQKSDTLPVAAAADPNSDPNPNPDPQNNPQGTNAQQASAQSGDNQSIPQSLHRREPGAPHATPKSLQPYITSGLTRDEVIAVLGAPTASTDGKLAYGASELDFTNGKLSGWSIAASAPIRVKLWPDAPVDPDLTSFKLGSTKNEVLVVQGTPTLYSEDTFGYGASRVFFKNNRVVGWKNDTATVPLLIAP
jgi:hypothetical protein